MLKMKNVFESRTCCISVISVISQSLWAALWGDPPNEVHRLALRCGIVPKSVRERQLRGWDKSIKIELSIRKSNNLAQN